MAIHQHYTVSVLSDGEPYRGEVQCIAEAGSEWVCDQVLQTDAELSRGEAKVIRDEIRELFEADLRRDYGADRFHWKGDRRSPLLRFHPGDRVWFTGGEGEVCYALPDQGTFGVRTTEGRVLNFNLKSLDHFLFRKL